MSAQRGDGPLMAERPGQEKHDDASDVLAKKTFYATLVACVLFALTVFAFVL